MDTGICEKKQGKLCLLPIYLQFSIEIGHSELDINNLQLFLMVFLKRHTKQLCGTVALRLYSDIVCILYRIVLKKGETPVTL